MPWYNSSRSIRTTTSDEGSDQTEPLLCDRQGPRLKSQRESVLSPTLQSRHYGTYFTDDKTEVQRS